MEQLIIEKTKKFSIILRELRKSEGLTQKQIAAKLCIAHQSYQAYEAGMAVPTIENFIKLCEIYNVTPNELLSYEL